MSLGSLSTLLSEIIGEDHLLISPPSPWPRFLRVAVEGMARWAGLCALVLLAVVAASAFPAERDDLAAGFTTPPDSARPWVYWFWLNGNITKEGITADLEAMKRVGIGGVLIAEAASYRPAADMEVDQGIPLGPVAFISDQWRELFNHVVTEAQRLGLEVNMNNDAGWNGSGGPWIKPEQSMQKVVSSEVGVEGPKHFEDTLKQPETIAGFYRDIAVLAFPTPGSYRIDNIDVKACYKTGGVGPAIETSLPAEMLIERDRITDISAKMNQSGRLVWDVPPGKSDGIGFRVICRPIQ